MTFLMCRARLSVGCRSWRMLPKVSSIQKIWFGSCGFQWVTSPAAWGVLTVGQPPGVEVILGLPAEDWCR